MTATKAGLGREIASFLKDFLTGFKWWLLAAPFVAVGSVYLARAYAAENAFARWWLIKGSQETAAVILLALATMIYARRYFYLERRQSRLTLVFLLLTAAFWCREIHFYGTHRGIWVALVLICLWALSQVRTLRGELVSAVERSYYSAAIWTYFVSQLIERRVFRASRLPLLPDEAALHVILEEVTENFGHLLIFMAALYGIPPLRVNSKQKIQNSQQI